MPPIDPELDLANREDLIYLGSLWRSATVSNADIRRSSATVRRLLLDGALSGSASPRRHKLTYLVPENTREITASERGDLFFFQSAGVQIGSVTYRAICMSKKEIPPPPAGVELEREVKIDAFLSQPVFFSRGNFVTRRTVIAYVANKAAGVHFDRDRPDEFATLDEIRRDVRLQNFGPTAMIKFMVDRGILNASDFRPNDGLQDPVFIELAATVRLLCNSPSIQSLLLALGTP